MGFWEFLWWALWVYLFIAYLYALIMIVTDLFRDRELGGWAKAAWLFFLIVLPLITALVYLGVRGRGMAERGAAAAERAKKETDSYIQQVAGRSPSEEIAHAAELHAAGTISTEEFEKLKTKALS